MIINGHQFTLEHVKLSLDIRHVGTQPIPCKLNMPVEIECVSVLTDNDIRRLISAKGRYH